MLKLNPEGCTIDTNFQMVYKNNGYFVALTDNVVNGSVSGEIGKLKEIANILNLKNHFYGYWRDNDKEYLDISIHIPSKQVALQVAKIHTQKAIYDCRNEACIYLQAGDPD